VLEALPNPALAAIAKMASEEALLQLLHGRSRYGIVAFSIATASKALDVKDEHDVVLFLQGLGIPDDMDRGRVKSEFSDRLCKANPPFKYLRNDCLCVVGSSWSAVEEGSEINIVHRAADLHSSTSSSKTLVAKPV
jgi:hypothetical protein